MNAKYFKNVAYLCNNRITQYYDLINFLTEEKAKNRIEKFRLNVAYKKF